MFKKRKIILSVLVICLIAINALVFMRKGSNTDEMKFHMDVKAANIAEFQIYYGTDTNFKEESSTKASYIDPGNIQDVNMELPSNAAFIRMDFGNIVAEYEISNIRYSYRGEEWEIPVETFLSNVGMQELVLEKRDECYAVFSLGSDPYIVLDVQDNPLIAAAAEYKFKINLIQNIIIMLILDLGAVLLYLLRKKIFGLPIELWQNRNLIWNLSVNDFKTKYAGSYLGIVWAFIQPIVTILVYWFVFTVGLKSGRMAEYPFVLYLISGIIPWFFFQDALNGGTNALIEYNYLVKKVVFKISILPIVKIISALFVHVFFVAFSLIICAAYGYIPGMHTIQIFYYSACTFVFTLGLVYATSAIVIFFRDLTQIINIFLQVGMWITPIMWDLTMLDNHPTMKFVFKMNPLYYIVSGYRDTMLGNIWFVAHWKWAIYFWAVTGVLFLMGALIFKRLKPHFADVL